jgi:hypothetical protein
MGDKKSPTLGVVGLLREFTLKRLAPFYGGKNKEVLYNRTNHFKNLTIR